MEEFKRLCDDVVILINNGDQPEIDMVKEYGFKFVLDRREWGAHQWRIKQDFIEREIKQMVQEGDMLVCLDMDETIPKLTKEWLREAPLDAYHVFIADLWNDPEHYKPESCFWNVRIWRWNGETKFKAKPVHCGLAPEWAYFYHRHAPFVLLHKGLMLREDRQRKVKRYEKYDPNARHLDRKYYDMLKSDTARPFDFEEISATIEKEVASYKQTKPRAPMAKKKERFMYVRNPHGDIVDIPEKHVEKTLKRPGFTKIGWADEENEDIEEMFEDTEVDSPEEIAPLKERVGEGAYQRSAADEEAEINSRNQQDEEVEDKEVDEMFEEDEDMEEQLSADQTGDTDEKVVEKPVDTEDHPKPNPNKPKEEKVETPKKKAPAKKTAAKKAAKKK